MAEDEFIAQRITVTVGQSCRIVPRAAFVQEMRAVVHNIGDAIVAKRAQPSERDGLKKSDFVGKVSVANRVDIAIVGAVRGCG